MRQTGLKTAVCTLVSAFVMVAHAQDGGATQALDPDWVKSFDWRLIGPANMSGRIVDIEVYQANPKIYYVGSASGGLLKTTNNGDTYEHLFDHESSVSIGDIAVSATDPDLVWIGTGEHNPRNSVSWGDGVYKSTDGGASWKHMGLKDTFQVGKVLIHPEDDDTVYVGALGRLWGPNDDRGVYRTTDGGESWDKVLFIDDKTGIIDMMFHPEDPDVILAAAWERERDAFDTNDPAKRWGPGSGLYRTEDGGDTWTEITKGLPSVDMGRMGMDWSGTDADTVYMLVDSVRIGEGIAKPGFLGMSGENADVGARLTQITKDGPAEKAGLKVGDIVIQVDGEPVLSYDDFLGEIRIREAGTDVTMQVARSGEVVDIDVTLAEHPDPSSKPFEQDLGGQRDSIQDQQGEDGYETGGLFKSTDAGKSWERINSINPRPMYYSKFRVDPSDDHYMWVLGTALSKSSDGGKTWTRDGAPGIVHVDHHTMWIDPNDGEHMILGNDGGVYVTHDRGNTFIHHDKFAIAQFYHIAVDNQPLYMVYGGLQDNGSWGGPNRSRTGDGTYNTDWFRIGGGDGFICAIDPDDPAQLYYESQNGGMGRVHLTTGERGWIRPRAPRGTEYRWNWKTPFMLSHHNPKIYYTAGNYVFRSYDKGNDIKRISPQVVRTRRGSSTAFDESPINPDLLMVGSDDGALWVSRDGGGEWENIMFPYDETAYTDESTESSDSSADRPARAANRAGSGRGAPTFAFFLERFDADEDGLLQTSEIPERMRPYGKMFDADDNGSINEEEMTQLREFVAALPGDAGGRGSAEESAEVTSSASARAPRTWAAASTTSDSSDEDSSAPAGPDHPLNGEWICNLGGEMAGSGQPPFTLIITKLDDEQFSVEIAATVLNDTTKSSEFDEDTGELSFSFTGPQGKFDFKAKLDDGRLVGNLGSEAMGFEAPFNGEREVVAEASDEPEGPGLEGMVPGPRRVQSIEWSKFERERVYIVLDGHYYDDDEPYVFVSEDAGKTWSSLRGNLPTGCSRVLREDMVNRNVLYLGTEFGLWVSVDRGASWTKFHNDLPTVSIHEVAQHESNGEIVVGTHGRGAWAIDVTPLQQMNAAARNAGVHLYTPNTVVQWRFAPERGRGAHGWFTGENPSRSASIYYSLGENASDLKIEVFDIAGRLVRTLDIPDGGTQAGLHKIDWDLRRAPPANSQRQRFRRGAMVGAGSYRLVLTSGDVIVSRVFDVVNDPTEPDVDFDFDGFFEGLEVEDEGVLDHEEAGVFD